MNKSASKGDWKIIKGKLKFAKPTGIDLRLEDGRKGELTGSIQKCKGQTKEVIERFDRKLGKD